MNNRQIIEKLCDRPIAFNPAFVPFAGICGALMLSQAIYWSRRTSDPDGWFYKTQKDWQAETGMTRTEQEKARRALRSAGVLGEERRGSPAKMYFRVDFDQLCEVVAGTASGPSLSDVLSIHRSTLTNLSKAGLMRAKKAGVEAEYVDYSEVLEQHGMVCGICGEPIARGLGQSQGSLSFDHKTPICKGGAHVSGNLQPAHAGCNLLKGGDDPSLLTLSKLDCLGKADKNAYAKQTYTETTTETTPESSVPTGTGATAPPTDLFGGKPTPPKQPDTLTEDARSQMWRMGVSLLTNQGLAESTARGLIGKWAKQGEKKLAGVIGECAVKPPADARAYINAAMQNAYNLYDEKQLKAAGKAYGVKAKQNDTWDTYRQRVQDAMRGGVAA